MSRKRWIYKEVLLVDRVALRSHINIWGMFYGLVLYLLGQNIGDRSWLVALLIYYIPTAAYCYITDRIIRRLDHPPVTTTPPT